MTVRILTGDCREIMKAEGPFDMIIADPPYVATSLAWDKKVEGWLSVAAGRLKPTGSIWIFGSMRSFMAAATNLTDAGLRYAQDVVWEKQNGAGWAADRFKRVHEHIAQFYRSDAPWAGVFNEVQQTFGHKPLHVSASRGIKGHAGKITKDTYISDGERIMRSIIGIRSCHGHAIHPTEKPIDLLQVLIRTSCPPGGLVGDFFAGSGSAADACVAIGRNYIGSEIDSEMATKAASRSLFVAGPAV